MSVAVVNACCALWLLFPGTGRLIAVSPNEVRAANLAAQPEALDQGVVTAHVLGSEVAQLATSLADELEEAASRGEVVLVLSQVVGEVDDAVREERYLHLWRTGVAIGLLVLVDNLDLTFSCLHALTDTRL